MTIPEGWSRVDDIAISCDSGKVTGVYTNGVQVVVFGEPRTGEDDEGNSFHNCDVMGCGWEHVLIRVRSTDVDAACSEPAQ